MKIFFAENRRLLMAGFLLFTFLFWATRLWRFEQLMGFHGDQALFMREISEMATSRKIRLVGPMVTSKMALGRGFFVGPIFYYFLFALSIICRWDVVLVTKLSLFIWWFAALVIMIWLGKKFGRWIGLICYGFFAVSPQLIQFSRKIWNPNFFPLFGALFFWLFGSLKKDSFWRWFGLGLLFGLGISFDYSAFLWLLFLAGLIIKERREGELKFYFLAYCLLGAVISELPLLIFELRHNFYNLRTIWFILTQGILTGRSSFILAFFNFYLPLVPVIYWLLALLLSKVERKWGMKVTVILGLSAMTLLATRIDFRGQWSQTVAQGWNVPKQKEVAGLICRDANNRKFEVATTVYGDTQAPDLRWWLLRKDCLPMGIEDYPKANLLYLIAPNDRLPERETVWEVASLRPFSITKSHPINNAITFYKLEKVLSN